MTGSSMKIKFNFDEMKWEGITVNDVKLWERMYPDVDVVKELKVNMIAWLDRKKGTKIAMKKDWKRTIHNWMKTEQDGKNA